MGMTEYLRSVSPRQALGLICINLHNTLAGRNRHVQYLVNSSQEAASPERDYLALSALVATYQITEDVGAIISMLQQPTPGMMDWLDNVETRNIEHGYSQARKCSTGGLRRALGIWDQVSPYGDLYGFTVAENAIIEHVCAESVSHHLAAARLPALTRFNTTYRRLYNVYKHVPARLLVYAHDGRTGVVVNNGRKNPNSFQQHIIDSALLDSFPATAQYANHLADQMLDNLNPRTAIDDTAHRLPHAVDCADAVVLAAYQRLVNRCPGGMALTGYTQTIDGHSVELTTPYPGSGIAISFVD